MSRAAAEAATQYQRTFHGRADEISQVRRDVASYLAGCPAADNAVLIASELAANSVVHSASGGEFFTVRCETYPDYVWIEVEDLGGPWQLRQPDDRPHGLDIIGALATRTTGAPTRPATETASCGPGWTWPRRAVPDPGRTPDVSDLTSGQLERTRRELAASLTLARPDSPARVPILAHITAIDTELAGRAGRAGRDARQP